MIDAEQIDPIAIVGIGCRFPGDASNPRKFWKLLCEGVDAIGDVPQERWDTRRFFDSNPDLPGKMFVNQGGFLSEKWEDFDAEFFQISPREARFLDPQQRLLLELTWEAMEDGCLIPEKIRGSLTSVFIGAFTTDWQTLQNSHYNVSQYGIYSGINSSMTILSARLSHFFDLRGPSLTVDTACSSSLVALHLGCQSLWRGESSMSIVGGVNAMLVPETTIAMSKGRFLNPEGRCRSFDDRAGGYVRGEGGGIVILKKLSEAVKDGDPVYALIRGTGVNQDGYTHGIVQPNPDAQKALIKKVLAESDVDPLHIHYVEAHGTGTPVGDPIEAMALNEVLQGKEKRPHPVYMGAVKSNFGHLEAAAGIAGLIKTALCLKYQKIPPNLHFNQANRSIPFEKYCLKIPQAIEDFPRFNHPLFACVNAFGYGGTNAHVVLQEYSKIDTPLNTFKSPFHSFLIPLSAKNEGALDAMIKEYARFLHENPEISFEGVANTLSQKRSHFEHRLAIAAGSTVELRDKLDFFSRKKPCQDAFKGKILKIKPKVAFVYTGMGPQSYGMGRSLMKQSPLFLDVLQRCDAQILMLTGHSLLDEWKKYEEQSPMIDPVIAQLANFSLQAALTDLLKSWGIIPSAVVGHSIGEVAAAYASGSLDLEQGILVSYHRSRLQSLKKEQGTMLAIGLGKEEAASVLGDRLVQISIAAVNSPRSLTLAGQKEELLEISRILDERNIFNRFLNVNIAYHSDQMDGLEKDVLLSLHKMTPRKPAISLFSTVMAEEVLDVQLDAAYWWKNIRQPVLFSQTIQNMIDNEYTLFVEIGPHPILGSFIKECLESKQVKGETLPSLNRRKNDLTSLMECTARLFVNGYELRWDKLGYDSMGPFESLPTYPWQKQSFWIESDESRHYRLSDRQHVMLSRKINNPYPTWRVEVNRQFFPWLNDHQIESSTVFPAAGFVEAGLAAFLSLNENVPCVMEGIEFEKLLTISPDKEPLLEVSLVDGKTFHVHSLVSREEWEWTHHASGRCSIYAGKVPEKKIDLSISESGNYIDGCQLYPQFSQQGLEYGPAFCGIKKLWKEKEEALTEIQLNEKSMENYRVFPPLLDCAFQTLIGLTDLETERNVLILPSSIDQFIFYKSPSAAIYCRAKAAKKSKGELVGDLVICDASGTVCLEIKGFHCRLLVNQQNDLVENLSYQLEWQQCIEEVADHGHNREDCIIVSLQHLHSIEEMDDLISRTVDKKNLTIVLQAANPINQEFSEEREMQWLAGCVNLVKSIETLRSGLSTSLWIFTRQTQAILKEDSFNLQGSTLWGMGRVIRQEHSHLNCRLIDIDKDFEWEDLKERIYSSEAEEIALRGSDCYSCHLIKVQENGQSGFFEKHAISSPSMAYALDIKKPGVIESLYYQQIEKKPPGKYEVSIEVQASSLNFKDLMKILGMLDRNVLEDTYFGNSFGMECSGKIVAVGPGVKEWKIGDQVCAFVPNTFQSFLTVPVKSIFRIPPLVEMDEAAIYIPFVTVLRALKECAKLKKGETVLIHSATGAVGLAAVQYARFVGAKIFATAGTPEKRAYLEALGVQGCSDSRSFSFVEDILKWTDGKGVDVVLNSLSGDFLTKSWSLLAPYGRFIEIGKRDISSNTGLPMRCFNRNTTFSAIDLDRTFIDRPKLMKSLLTQAHALFVKGVFKTLPCEIFPAGQAVEAFKMMARSQHIGKIMLKFDRETVEAIPLKSRQAVVNSHASYLLTGGFSGLGLATAKWLIEKGARHLILLGRRGPASIEAQEALKEFQLKGIQVKAAAIDITDIRQLACLLEECRGMPPLKGIIHSAMVLEDAWLTQLTPSKIANVLGPKMSGCINLHHLTKHLPLDFFVLFSSISSIIGNPGQGNYAAANAFLDSFSHFRHRLGLPALTINWGALDLGVLARNSHVAKQLDNYGIHKLSLRSTLSFLENAIQGSSIQTCAFDVDWPKLSESLPGIKKSSVFKNFSSKSKNFHSFSLIEELRAMDDAGRLNACSKIIKENIANILGMEPEKIESSIRLNALGVDSLMAMELQSVMESRFGIKIPTMELMKGPTVDQLTKFVCTHM